MSIMSIDYMSIMSVYNEIQQRAMCNSDAESDQDSQPHVFLKMLGLHVSLYSRAFDVLVLIIFELIMKIDMIHFYLT